MVRISLLETAHGIVRRHLRPGDAAIDATLGNGHDTAFLAACVAEHGRVFGFDVQAAALDETGRRLVRQGVADRALLFHASHAEMAAHIPAAWHGRIRAVMFNLGYLPGSDKSVITEAASTLTALDSACRLLAEDGVLTVLAYPGHAGGDRETQALTAWCENLDGRQFGCEIVLSQHEQANAPRLFIIRKQIDLL